jgi:hypothetical protein
MGIYIMRTRCVAVASIITGLIVLLLLGSVEFRMTKAKSAATATLVPHKSLEQQLGFTSSVLSGLQQHGVTEVADKIEFIGYEHEYRLVHVITPLNAINTQQRIGAVLLFQVEANEGKLLWRIDVDEFWDIPSIRSKAWPNPGDWEKSGNINFAIFTYTLNTCPLITSYLEMFILRPDGTVSSQFRNVIPAGHLVEAIERRQNRLVLKMLDIRGFSSEMNYSSCRGPVVYKYFELSGTTLKPISDQYSKLYLSEINDIVTSLTQWKPLINPDTDSIIFSSRVMKLLLIYDAIGKREYGYKRAITLTQQALANKVIEHNTYLDTIFLPTMNQLHSQNLPFVPPEFVGPNPQDALDFY